MRDAGLIVLGNLVSTSEAGLGVAADSTGDVLFIFVPAALSVFEIGYRVHVVSTSNNIQVSFYDRPVKGSTSGETLIDIVKSGTTAAADSVIFKSVNYNVPKGNVIRVNVSNAGASSCTVVPYVKAYPAGDAKLGPVDVESL